MGFDQPSIRIIHFFKQNSSQDNSSIVLDLNNYLLSQHLDSSVIYLDDEGVFHHCRKDSEAVVCRRDKKTGFDIALIFKLARYLKLEKIQAVHIHDINLLPIVNLSAGLAGIKSFYTQHGLLDIKVKNFWFGFNTALIFNSSYVLHNFLKFYKISEKKCSVIFDGFDIENFQESQRNVGLEELKKEAGINADHFVLGNMGGLKADQDQMSLLKSFRKLAKKALNAILIIVGDGPMKSDLEAAVREFGLEGRVKFVPQTKDADQWMQIFNVYVLSANVENYARYILKAFACSKPVIATKIGSQTELINDDIGFLVPCAFPERIESAVMRLYASQDLVKKMGGKAKVYLAEKLSMDRMASDYASLYKSFLLK